MLDAVAEVKRAREISNANFGLRVRSQPRSEIAGHLARRSLQGWCAASGRALRASPRRLL